MPWTEVNLDRIRSPPPPAASSSSASMSSAPKSPSEAAAAAAAAQQAKIDTPPPRVVPPEVDIQDHHLADVFAEFRVNQYDASAEKPGDLSIDVSKRCLALFELDNRCITMRNVEGNLCPHYPSQIHIPVHQRHPLIRNTGPISPQPAKPAAAAAAASASPQQPPAAQSSTSTSQPSTSQPQPTTSAQSMRIEEKLNTQRINEGQLRLLWQKSRLARCRARFPVPVILWRNKFVARSATLSGCPEAIVRTGTETMMTSLMGKSDDERLEDRRAQQQRHQAMLDMIEAARDENQVALAQPIDLESDVDAAIIEAARSSDIKLLQYLRIGVINDLMVENKKNKYGMKVSSSEKIDSENRYNNFLLSATPYPGCEFFTQFRKNAHSTTDLRYDWDEQFNDADFRLGDITQHWSYYGRRHENANQLQTWHKTGLFPDPPPYEPLDIDWSKRKDWDLNVLTMNYLRSCLHNLNYSDNGTLVHCISGWDRTPLFVSLLRITLWADNEIHQSLSPLQMLYLTVGYDWYLFGHRLLDRLEKGEDIFLFCFDILKDMTSKEMMIDTRTKPRTRTKRVSNSSTGSGDSMTGAAYGGGGGGAAGPIDLSGMILEEDEPPLNSDHVDGAHAAAAVGLDDLLNSNSPSARRTGRRNRTVSGASAISEHDDDVVDEEMKKSKSTDSLFAELDMDPSCAGASFFVTPRGTQTRQDISAPIAMPGRKRNDSTSSTGSWAMVTRTGSVGQGDCSGSLAAQFQSPNKSGADEEDTLEKKLLLRKYRLDKLRELFYTIYFANIGRSKEHGKFGQLGL